jgi:hypothetical protein
MEELKPQKEMLLHLQAVARQQFSKIVPAANLKFCRLRVLGGPRWIKENNTTESSQNLLFLYLAYGDNMRCMAVRSAELVAASSWERRSETHSRPVQIMCRILLLRLPRFCSWRVTKTTNSVAFKRTIPTERPSLVGEI